MGWGFASLHLLLRNLALKIFDRGWGSLCTYHRRIDGGWVGGMIMAGWMDGKVG